MFADLIGCNNGSTTSGVVDVIDDPTCTINVGDGSNSTYPNWAAFVLAKPTYRIANEQHTTVIQDGNSGPQFTVFNVQIVAKSRGGK